MKGENANEVTKQSIGVSKEKRKPRKRKE
jgi:hypothetical protein